MTVRISFVLFVLCSVLPAQAGDQGGNPSGVLTVCEILSMPSSYDGKLVTIRERVSNTDEGAWLEGIKCPGVFVTDGVVWPRSIWLQYSDSRVTRLHQPDFSKELILRSEYIAERKYVQLKRRVPDRCIVWTYTGMFETKQNWSSAKVTYHDGTSRFIGFGHLGDAPAQLLIRTVDAVSELPNCAASKKDKNSRK
jgi:hypothetical protein